MTERSEWRNLVIMNTGPIAYRYAKSLLKYVLETGAGEKVYSQACVLVLRMQGLEQLSSAIQKHPELDLDRKIKLLEAALGEPLADGLLRFIKLVYTNDRIGYFLRMIASFAEQYRTYHGIKAGTLVTACPVPGLRKELQEVMESRTGFKVVLDESIDESLIGGFVLQVDDLRMDASVEGQLKRLRRSLVDESTRIV